MKKIISLLLVAALVSSLTISAFAAANTSYSTNASICYSCYDSYSVYGYTYRDEAKITDVSVQIGEFTTNSTTCRVRVGKTWYTGHIQHEKGGSRSYATIRVDTGSFSGNMDFGLPAPYDVNCGHVKIVIRMSFFGSRMDAKTMKISGDYKLQSIGAVNFATSGKTYDVPYFAQMKLVGNQEGGWYTISASVETSDYGTDHISCLRLCGIYENGKEMGYSYSISNSRANISGKYRLI